MRAALLIISFAVLGVAGIPSAAISLDWDVLWRLETVTESGETPLAATFGANGGRMLHVGCDRPNQNLEIRYPAEPIPARLGDIEVVIEGGEGTHLMRAERIAGGVRSWAPVTAELLAALRQDGPFRLVLPYQREPLEIGRAEPLRLVAESCRARGGRAPE